MKSFTKILLSAILLLCTIIPAKAVSDAFDFDLRAYANNYLKTHNMTAAQLSKLKAKADAGDYDAQFVYWIIDNYFPQGKKSQESARYLFIPAKQGHAKAQYVAGSLLLTAQRKGRKGTEADAKNYLTASANQNFHHAQYLLGESYALGDWGSKDYNQALSLFRKAAAQGNANAMLKLGAMYKLGMGVDKNLTEAANWYLKAAKLGATNAQNTIAYSYYNGTGIERNYDEAFKWGLKAAQSGNVNSQALIGLMYMMGQGCALDFDESEKWFTKAADKGNETAINGLYLLGDKLYNLNDLAKAKLIMEKAAQKGCAPAKEFLQTQFQ